MKKIHYGWSICIGCTLLMFITLGLTSTTFSVYLPYIILYDGLTNTQISLISTVRSLSALFAFFSVDWYYRSNQIRPLAVITALGTALSFVLLGLSKGFWGYCAGSVVAGVASAWGGIIPTAILVNRWFQDSRGTVLGICFAGTGVSAIVIPPLITALIAHRGLHQTFFIIAGAICVLSALLYLMLSDSPQQKGLRPYQKMAGRTSLNEPQPPNDPVVIPRAYYLAVMFAMILLGAASDPAYIHISVLYDAEGYDLRTITLLLSLAGACLMLGKLALGQIADRKGIYWANYLFFLLLILGLASCSFAATHQLFLAYAGMIGIGMGASVVTVGISTWAFDMSGAAGYAKTLKQFQIFNGLGKVLFYTAPGVIADLTGSYVMAYALLACFALIILLIVQLTYIKFINPAREKPTTPTSE